MAITVGISIFLSASDIYLSPFKEDENAFTFSVGVFGKKLIFIYLRLKESLNKAHLFTVA